MKTNFKRIKPYLIEFIIVTSGVMIALILSNIKEYNQTRKYHIATVETINNEIKSNHSSLKEIVEKQTNLLDTLIKYTEDSSSIVDLFKKSNGLQYATIHNSGLEFYKRNQMNSIDLDLMSTLINMNILSDVIDNKLDKFSEFVYSNAFSNSKESKMVVILHLQDVINTENQLLGFYEDFMDNNIGNGNNS